MRKCVRFAKRFFTVSVIVSTIFWSIGISALLMPKTAKAAVVAEGVFDLGMTGGMNPMASSFDFPVLRFSLVGASSETLTSVAITIKNNTNSAVTDNNLADHTNEAKLWRDSNNNNYFEQETDTVIGTQAVVKVATSTTVITATANNSIAASGLPTSFFVTLSTDSGWATPDSILVDMAATGITLSDASHPTITALTGTKAISASAGGSWGGFSIGEVTFVNSTTVDVRFTELLNLNSGTATTTSNYTLTTTAVDTEDITSVVILPDNMSVRVIASGATISSIGTDRITVNENVKNSQGRPNANTSPTPIFSGMKPLVISEIKAGTATDEYDEFIELYNRSSGAVPTSTIKLHLLNVNGTVDTNVNLTFLSTVSEVPAHKFLLIAPVTSSASTTADAVYTTSSIMSIITDGAVYISNSTASSTAVIDKVCWGSHSNLSDCEGSAVSALSNNGVSIERKAFNTSTSATMGTGGTDATKGNSVDTQNNSFDFIVRATPEPQNSRIDDPGEVPSGGSYGGSGNGAPSINFAPIFRASKDAALNFVARIFDDGGPVTAGNTQLIYCTTDTTCAPASSTPIYGTSIGSGWYKFSSTSTNAWSNDKASFKYYLQASDSATPAKTRVFTNDPSFDMNTYDTAGTGIQTAALQQSKAVAMALVSGNLGSASISGTVNNSSGSALSGATVWIDGTQYAATTGNDGTFSFSNIGPSGGSQLKIAKEGYADQSLSFFIPSSGLVSLPTIILYSGTMGQGGDYSMPNITNTTPSMGMSGFQTQTPESAPPAIEVNFSKTMDITTITDTDASNAGSAIYLTLAGSETKIAGAVSGTATKATFIPTAALTAGKAYTLFVTPAVKDTVGNPVSGNGQGGSYVLMFSTVGQMYAAPENITNFGQGDSFPPYVIGSQPSPGKSNVVLNTKVFISFSEAMQNTASNIAKVKLYKVTSPFTASESKALVSTTNSIDASNKIVMLSFSNLDASSHYRVEVLGGITSSKGIPLGNPGTSGYGTSAMFMSDFETGTSSDDSAPTISGTIPAASATGISTIKPVVVSFSEAMDPTTITESSVSLKLGSTVISGDLSYDPNSWMATFVSDFSLTPTSTYTITVTTDVKNLSGLALASSLMRTFTTGSTDSISPMVTSAQANEYSLKVSFSKPMLASTADDTVNYAYSVLKASNYSVRVVNSSGVAQSTVTLPSTATLNYDNSSRSVAISGLPTITGLTTGTTLMNITVSNVKDIAYNNLSSNGNAATTTAQSSQKTGNFSSSFGGAMGPMMNGEGNIIQGGMTSGMSAMVGTYGTESGIGFIPGVKVYPFSPMAGMISTYGVEAPISYQIPAGGFIDITFPEGTDVSQAKKDINSPPNNDINGSNLGAVIFATSEGTLPSGWSTGGQSNDGVIVDSAARIVRVILGAVATRSENSDTHDFLRLDIAQITNSTLSRSVDTSGNNATVETKKSDGTMLETLSSGAFFTSSAGTLTLRGQIKSGSTGLNGVKVFLMSPATGSQSTTTLNNKFGGNDGEFQFENLPSGSFMLGVDRYFKTADGEFMSNPPNPMMLNNTTCTSNVCTQNVSVTDASGGAAVTLDITGTFNNATVDIFAGGPGSFRMVTSTLNGALENDTSNSIKLNSNGVWMVGFYPSMSTEMFNKTGMASSSNWMAPRPQQVIVSGCPAACVANPSTVIFSSSAAGKMVKFTVKDASGNALGQAHVFAYSPGLGMGSDTQAGADGTGSINLSYGTYKIGADVPGMPSSIERTIAIRSVNSADKVFIDGSSTGTNLGSMTAANLILTVSKPDYTISGRVTDGTNPISNVPVNAYRTNGPGHAEAMTNSSGDYTLYVCNGTWKAQAMMPDYGKLAEKTITVNGASVSSQNFQPNTASVNYGTLTKSVYVDTNNDGAYVAADDEELGNAQVTVKGTTSGGETYFNTALTDTNGSSTLKLPPGTYTMDVWSPTLGSVTSTANSFTVASNGTITSAPSDILVKPTGTMTINILDENGNATTTPKAVVEFQQINGTLNKVESFSVASTTISLPKYDAGADSVAINSSTSTNPNNFYLMTVSIPGFSPSSLISYGGNGTIMATSTAVSGLWKVEADGNEAINIKLPSVNYVSGTVKDASGTAVADATVHMENKTTGEVIDVQADSSGIYTTRVSDGTYLMSAGKDGYIDTASTVTISDNGTVNSSYTTMSAATYTITGTIKTNGTATVGATVRGERLGGGIITATTGTDGTYTLRVITGDWKVSASADGYNEKSYGSVVAVGTAGVSGIDINITSTNSTLAGATSMSITPQTGGALTDTAASLSINAGLSALATSANTYSLNEKETSNVVGGGSGTPIANEAKTVTSYNDSGNGVSILNKDVSVTASYSTADLTTSLGTLTTAVIEKVNMGSWDDTADNWQNLPTTIGYKNSSGNFIEPASDLSNVSTVSFTGQTMHFSVFNPIESSDGLAPSAPTTVAAVAGNGSVTITWTAPTTNADDSALTDLLGYEIYRATTVGGTYTQINASDISGASYTDSAVTNGNTYYYKVTAADNGGLESAFSSASNAGAPSTHSSASSGGSAVIVQPAPVLGTTPIITKNGLNVVYANSVILKLNSSNAVQMAISEKSDFSDVSWESYVAEKTLKLSDGLGEKKIYVKFRTASGGLSEIKFLNLTVLAPLPGQKTEETTVLVVPTPSASVEKQTVASANAESNIAFSNLSSVSFQPGVVMKFSYKYLNSGVKSVKIKLVRQLLNAKGKAITTASAVKTIKAGKYYQANIKETVNKKLPAGVYTVKIKVLDAKSGKVLDQNSFGIEIEKLKYKTFIMGDVASASSDITFNESYLAKIKSDKKLPVILKLKYGYTNTTETKQTIKMVRQLLNESGKVLSSKTGKWVMIPGEFDSLAFTQPVAGNLAVGDYTIRVAAYDRITNELIAENSVNFSVELK